VSENVSRQMRSYYHRKGTHNHCDPSKCMAKRQIINSEQSRPAPIVDPNGDYHFGLGLRKAQIAEAEPIKQGEIVSELIRMFREVLPILREQEEAETSLGFDGDEPTDEVMAIVEHWERSSERYINAIRDYKLDSLVDLAEQRVRDARHEK
jgi:hypothetical protein